MPALFRTRESEASVAESGGMLAEADIISVAHITCDTKVGPFITNFRGVHSN